jgi:hypothetical protein
VCVCVCVSARALLYRCLSTRYRVSYNYNAIPQFRENFDGPLYFLYRFLYTKFSKSILSKWDVMLCSPLKVNRRFGGIYCICLRNRHEIRTRQRKLQLYISYGDIFHNIHCHDVIRACYMSLFHRRENPPIGDKPVSKSFSVS